ncbi:DedA family protein [Prolixibacter sp. SD074]|uniref:DedA family protein n=1 Tax=Prolixibacter sp. SD074 TaxID=2652391 RepID=UPI00127E3B0B|nr:DedA family protein [Prolixibacter sp. SD074]GET30248.1 hypothetical protein SD074_24500 [Prolixibacter sp. SD074]
MDAILTQQLHIWTPLIYVILFVGLLIEGESILFAAFFLVNQQELQLFYTIVVAIAGVLTGDLLWYYGGKLLMRVPFVQRLSERMPKTIDHFIRRKPILSIVGSKFLYGMHRPTLLRLHAARINVKTFLRADIPGTIIWIAVIGIAGYLFSQSADLLDDKMKYWQLGMVGGLVIFTVLTHFVSKLVVKYITVRKK